MISINYNPSVLKTQNNLNIATSNLNKSLLRMSTGFKINSAADDAAGLYIATKLNSQIRGLKQAQANISNGMSYLNIAEGALSNMTGILNRVRDLAVQGANDIYDDNARTAMQSEADALVAELDRIKGSTLFNGMNVFKGNSSVVSGTANITRITPDSIPTGYTAIYTAEDLNNIRNNMSGKYILMNDIDLSGVDWTPIGIADTSVSPNIFTPFTGTLDGNGYVISNMHVNGTQESKGLFGYISRATVKNLGIENSSVTGGLRAGILSGYASGSATIENCYAIDSVINNAGYSGGLIGFSNNINLNITNSYTNVEMKMQRILVVDS